MTGLALSRGTADRAGERRSDEAWLAATWADAGTRILAVHEGETLTATDAPRLAWLTADRAPDGDRFFLGLDDGVAYFAVAGPLPETGARAAGLRELGASLDAREAGLLAHAVALERWHSTHTHCPRCGAPTRVGAAGHVRVCTEDGSQHFPRVDPAVIMLVHDDADRMLLARNSAWPERRYSVLAGFVEPGESLEQAVAREVGEEVGIAVTDPVYLGSQPWPFPSSLMLGFFARAVGDLTLRADDDEIAEARWVARDSFPSLIRDGVMRFPPGISIARRLIERWYGGPIPDDSDWRR
ncbi:MAG: NAD(+) diphosphatase [Streptosporangiales bacterium]|nr:NAD(+) diphosphatase [Streptosporangiales bacterium]